MGVSKSVNGGARDFFREGRTRLERVPVADLLESVRHHARVDALIVTETVFNVPGVARFLVEAIRSRDYPIVQNLVIFIAVVVVTVNFLVDLAYTALDPRIRLES